MPVNALKVIPDNGSITGLQVFYNSIPYIILEHLYGNFYTAVKDGSSLPSKIEVIETLINVNPLLSVITIDKLLVTADGIDKVTLSNVPSRTVVTVTGIVEDAIVVSDGVLELTFLHPGEYIVSAERADLIGERYKINAI